MKDVEIGMITAPLGIKGEVKVKSYAEDPSRFRKIRNIGLKLKHISGKESLTEYEIERARIQGGMVVLKLAGVDDRDAAELLRQAEVYMDSDDLEELPEGEHYIRDLLGLDVVSFDTGEKLGILSDVLTDRPQDIFVVRKEDGSEFMVPSVPEFIRDIDEKNGVIRVSLIEGMI